MQPGEYKDPIIFQLSRCRKRNMGAAKGLKIAVHEVDTESQVLRHLSRARLGDHARFQEFVRFCTHPLRTGQPFGKPTQRKHGENHVRVPNEVRRADFVY